MRLPKIVFVSIAGEGKDEYLHAEKAAKDLAEAGGGPLRIGKYEPCLSG